MNRRILKLSLLQIENYDLARYWHKSHKKIDPDLIKRLKWTSRAKITYWLSFATGLPIANWLIGSGLAMYELYIWNWCRLYIKKLKRDGLRVVAIVGSYGKTSVKMIAYDLIRQKYRTVATAGNYNTLFGIFKTLKYEVDHNTKVFVAEIGAYHEGDIEWLAKMVQPDIGVLTGITSQHLERFGSMEAIVRAKTEIVRYVLGNGGVLIANGSDELVKANVGKGAIFYTGNSRDGINMAGAMMTARQMGMTEQEIVKAKSKIRAIPNRLEMTETRYGMKVIDNSYSSNEKSFVTNLEYLAKQNRYCRILVTSGIVELGHETATIHKKLGKLIVGKVDWVLLVGKNERTRNLESGINGQVKIEYIEKTLDFMSVVKHKKLKQEPLVLLENDVTENY